ncbi:class II histocompatibility antigen, B-L beta chain-like [Scyliorhinus canicula]|uniref:class II histocompatibility antigen, B-L beta chain-like n=1 Tax=Scyliorhinus canicula TaxID=7830 RepID=UPI0018F609A0|nr:class II histocompatibility antigen, B-L beta chain-like [Scyliorhinus canicula]
MSVIYRWVFVAVAATVASVLDLVDCSTEPHYFHMQCACVYGDNKPANLSSEMAYDGAAILYYDIAKKTFVAAQSIGQAEVNKRNKDINIVLGRIESLCDKIKETAIISNLTIEKMAPIPSRVFLQEKSGQMNLVCLVKDFFPRDIKMSWLRNGVVIANRPQTVNIVPQDDKTFQARSLLTLNEDVSGSYICQVEHEALTRKLQVPFRYDRITKNEALIIIGAVLGILGISFAVVTGILYYCNLNRSDQFNVNPIAKFTKRAGPCGRNSCSSSVRSGSSETSNTSNTSCSSADDLTKSHV